MWTIFRDIFASHICLCKTRFSHNFFLTQSSFWEWIWPTPKRIYRLWSILALWINYIVIFTIMPRGSNLNMNLTNGIKHCQMSIKLCFNYINANIRVFKFFCFQDSKLDQNQNYQRQIWLIISKNITCLIKETTFINIHIIVNVA